MEEWNAQILIHRKLKGRETIDAHFVLKAAYIAWPIAGCGNPYLMATIGKICCKTTSHRWNTAHHWRILVCYNHDAHRLSLSPISNSLLRHCISLKDVGVSVSAVPACLWRDELRNYGCFLFARKNTNRSSVAIVLSTSLERNHPLRATPIP